MRSKFKWIFTLLVALSMQFSFAQEKTVTGVVSDDKGTLPGANVVVKGTTKGVESDMDGKYSIKVNQGETLVYSFIGMQDQTRVVGASSTINVNLITSAKVLDEVIVGYGKRVSRLKQSAAVSTIGSEDIEGRPNVNFLSNLQGQAAGLNIGFSSGSPGTNKIDVLIRGESSLSGSNEPLYVIDGMPLNQSFFRNLNPEDIESSSILKDAAATAIYGNRGANGVIIINTKKGSFSDSFSMRYSTIMSFTSLIDHDYNLVNAREHLTVQNIQGVGLGSTLTPDEIGAYGIDTQWKDFFYQTGVSKQHNLSFSAGSKNLSNYTSLGYLEQEGILRGTGFQRFTLRSNFSGKSTNERFKYSTNINANYSKRNQVEQETRGGVDGNVLQNPLNGYLYSATYLDPAAYVNGQQLFNDFGAPAAEIVPYMLLDYLNPNNIPSFFAEQKLIINSDASYKLNKNFTVGTNVGVDYAEDKRVFARAPQSYLAIVATAPGALFGGIETQNSTREFSFNAVTRLNYNVQIKEKHTIDVTLYSEYLKAHRNAMTITQSGLDPRTYSPGAGTGWIPFNPANPNFYAPSIAAAKRDAGLFSYFATADYDYNSLFGIGGSIRRDASYKFTDDNQWGTFWSASARINLHKLAALSDSNWIKELKLRASHGSSGNQNVQGRGVDSNQSPAFISSQLIRDLSAVATPVNSYNGNPAWVVANVANTDLRWETVTQSNIGIDFNLKNRLTGTVDVYRKETSALFQDTFTSAATLSYNFASNSGIMRNDGVELALRFKAINKGGLKLDLFANGSYNKNYFTELPLAIGQERIRIGDGFVHEINGPAFQYFAVPYLGVNQNTGEMEFLDINNNVTTAPTDADRRTTGNNYLPVFQGGFGFDLDYKGFYINTLFTYKADFYRYDDELSGLYDINFVDNYPVSADVLNAWTTTNTNTDIPSFDAIVNQTAFSDISDRFLRDASFIRLRSLTVGYNIPSKLLKGTYVRSVKLFGQAENMVTWTKWRGFDPDNFDAGGVGRYPTPRIISFGLDIEF